MALNPFDWSGPSFLLLYLVLLAVTLVAGVLIPRWLRPDGLFWPVREVDELAVLAGGTDRFVDMTAARLLERGALRIDGKNFRVIGTRGKVSGAEAAALGLASPFGWSSLKSELAAYAQPVEARLVARGLLFEVHDVWQMRLFQTLPFCLLIGFGSIKLLIGLSREKPVGLLVVLLVITSFMAAFRFALIDRRTQAGRSALADARSREQRLSLAPTLEEAALAVALFGTTVLAASSMSDFYRLRAASGGDGGGGDSGGSGCGGGGGGGCGGCGS